MSVDRLRLAAVGVRRAPTIPVLSAGVIAGLAVIAGSVLVHDASDLLHLARLSGIVVAVSATAAVDDPSAGLTDTIWRGRLPRTLTVLRPTTLLVALVWFAPVRFATSLTDAPSLPVAGLLLEVVVLTIVGWLITAWIDRSLGRRGASVAGASAVAILGIASMSAPRTAEWFWRSPGDGWVVSHLRWAIVGGIAFAILAAIWREPARALRLDRR